jgi:hypothetical protein
MNKVFRLLGSATLATGLVLGGSAGIASANDYRDDHRSDNKYNDHKRDNRHDDNKRDGRHDNDRNRYEKDRHDRHWDGRYGYVYDHNHHDKDCDGKFHRVWFKNNHGQWQFVIVIVNLHH